MVLIYLVQQDLLLLFGDKIVEHEEVGEQGQQGDDIVEVGLGDVRREGLAVVVEQVADEEPQGQRGPPELPQRGAELDECRSIFRKIDRISGSHFSKTRKPCASGYPPL